MDISGVVNKKDKDISQWGAGGGAGGCQADLKEQWELIEQWGLVEKQIEKPVVFGLRDNLLERVTKGFGAHLGCGKQKGWRYLPVVGGWRSCSG